MNNISIHETIKILLRKRTDCSYLEIYDLATEIHGSNKVVNTGTVNSYI